MFIPIVDLFVDCDSCAFVLLLQSELGLWMQSSVQFKHGSRFQKDKKKRNRHVPFISLSSVNKTMMVTTVQENKAMMVTTV
jgi:hypothetical protein